uniref:14.5 kDa salivary protein n=1 Tax=Phlebotomus duboscqi TaxID=37738 RepID=Q06K60_PHLDU|nr:14.5 kDa salivary protein [Phlebotomus duboscqi]
MNSLLCLLVICAAGSVLTAPDPETVSAKITLVEDVDEFVRANPGVTLTKLDNVRTARAIHNSLGQRVSGDRLVARNQDSASWGSLQNVQLTVNYPANGGYGAVVSYVSILVDQTSNLGNGYVLYGGIGQRQIGILIEARNTYTFSYIAEIYGL